MWSRLWHRLKTLKTKDEWTESPSASEDPELREIYVRTGLRVAAGFALIFGLVYFAFWWSGSAVGFGANRASGKVEPTWRVFGTVRNAVTREPIPWALVEDDPGGRPPLYHIDANYSGSYELITLAEPHRLRVSAPGYQSGSVQVGRAWFLWIPKGSESRDVLLVPK
jgi:hypothetical protein